MRIFQSLGVVLLAMAAAAGAQTGLTDTQLASWRQQRSDYVVFDIRSPATDSLALPAFRTAMPETWIDSLNSQPGLLIIAGQDTAAQSAVQRVRQAGYPADSVFYAIYSQIATRRPAGDSLPLSWLTSRNTVPLSQTLSAAQLWAVRLSQRPYMLIDVRSTGEVASGLIPGACNVVWTQPFQTNCTQWDKSLDIILNCASGNRAGQARTYLIGQGFDGTRVINFGGFSNWSGFGGPVSLTPNPNCNCTGIEGKAKGQGLKAEEIGLEVRPNPFNSAATIVCNVRAIHESPLHYSVSIYSAAGKLVAALVRQSLSPGHYSVTWNAQNLPSGLYLVKIQAGATTLMQKVFLMK